MFLGIKDHGLVELKLSNFSCSFLWTEGLMRCFPPLRLQNGFPWAAKLCHFGCQIDPERPVSVLADKWQQMESSRHPVSSPACSLRGRDVSLKHYAGCSASISVTVRAGEREIGKSLDTEGKMPPLQFLWAYFPHSHLVFLPRAAFGPRCFSILECFLPSV